MRFHRTIAIVLLSFLFLLAGGCSGGGDDDTADETGSDTATETSGEDRSPPTGDRSRESYVAAFTDGFDNVYATAEHMSCMAEVTVDVIGVETLRDTGPPDQVLEAGGVLQSFGIQLDEATAGALVDALDTCTDMRTLVFGDDRALSPDEVSCLEARVPDDVFRAYMISTYTSADGLPGDAELETVSSGYNECTS